MAFFCQFQSFFILTHLFALAKFNWLIEWTFKEVFPQLFSFRDWHKKKFINYNNLWNIFSDDNTISNHFRSFTLLMKYKSIFSGIQYFPVFTVFARISVIVMNGTQWKTTFSNTTNKSLFWQFKWGKSNYFRE